MLYVDRAAHPAPACLSDERSEYARSELRHIFSLDRQTASQAVFPSERILVQDKELTLALDRLFNRRCAFCESSDRTLPYRFRPAEQAGPSHLAPRSDADRAHLYYAWLANAWENLYPICAGCLPREPSVFPTIGARRPLPDADELDLNFSEPTGGWITRLADRPLFLDPCQDNDVRKQLAALPRGELIGVGERGSATIVHFDLNRPELCARRASAFDGHRRLLLEDSTRDAPSGEAFGFRHLDFGGGWFLLLYQMAIKLGGGRGGRPALSINRIDRYYLERFKDPDFAEFFEEAWFDLMERPDQLLARPVRSPRSIRGEARPVSFEIQNFKALENIQLEIPYPLKTQASGAGSALVILGENAAGKSSLLEAMTLALVDEATRQDLGQDGQRYMLDPRLMGEPGQRRRRGRVAARFEDGAVSAVGVQPGFPALTEDQVPRPPVFAYGAYRLYLAGDKQLRRASPIRSLFDPGYVLPNPERWLAAINGTPAFSEVARVLKVVFGFDQDDDVIVVEKGVCYLRVRHEQPDRAPVEQRTPLSVVSSGFRSVLAMVCDVLRGLLAHQDRFSASLALTRAVVLVDEIEAHLHPRWKMRIVHALREALPNVVFILTTHDPLCLRGLSSEEVMVFRRVRAETDDGLPVVVEQLVELPDVGALTIEQILTSDLFDLFSTDGPQIERQFARAADLLAAEQSGRVSPEDWEALRQIRDEIARQVSKGVPVGNTEVERLIQEAVVEYLIQRRAARADSLRRLRQETRNTIVQALGGL